MNVLRVHRTGGPDVLQFEQIPNPDPGPGEALVTLEAIGINYIEVYQRTGLYPLAPPFVPGREGAGIVTAIGKGVTLVKVGDRVVSESLNGSYAEFATVQAERLVVVPDGIDIKTAAAVMLQGLTAHYLATSTYTLAPGDTCLVHAAAGGVGLLLCQIASRIGATVIGTTSTAEKAVLAREAGARDVILYTEQDFVAETKRLTNGRGVQVVYDSVGKTTFDKSLDCLAPRGMMVLYGASSGPVPPVDPQVLNRKGSLFLTRPTLVNYVAARDELLARAHELFDLVRADHLRVRIGHTFTLKDAAAAHRALEGRQTTGKVILLP
jgi:NADPH2:quinone reductase